MDYRLLGPVEVEREGRVLRLGGPKQRAVLAILLLRRGSSVPSDVLIDELWGESAPATARNALQGYVFQLRKVLEPEVERGGRHRIVVGDGAGYRLETEPGQLDIERFERLTEEGKTLLGTSPAAAAARLEEALALWRGPPLADLAFEPFAQPELHRLEEMRLAALEDRFDALLAAGRHAEVVGELEALIESRPLRERLWGQLLLALYRSGRQADALDAYARAREELVEQLGVEPGPDLRRLQRGILEQDPDLDAPAPRARTVVRHPPRPAGRLLGRAADVERVAALLREHRLVTLLGPGGVGKTRLALAVAERVAGDFPDGVAWAPLEAIREPPLVPSEIAVALGNSDDVAAELEGRRVLLVLDNLEQVLGCAASLAELIAATSDVRLLVTSREPLDIAAERRYQVSLLDPAAAIELFNDRADAVGVMVDEDAAAVAAICDRLEGLPLAVELAAARTTVFSPEELLLRLDSAPDLLDGARRDAPDRHHTLRATINWSHELLDEAERALFRQLSVFAGGCTLDSAAVVTRAGLDAVSSLVGKSLLRAGDGRVRMLATIREFAQERLEESGDASEVRGRHARHYLDLARVADEELTGPDHADAFARLAQEQDNIRAALTWAVGSDRELALELAAAVGWFWFVRGQLDEGTLWLEAALAADAGSPATRATVSMRAGAIADARGDYGRAEAHYRVALQLRRDGGDLAGAVGALNNLGALAHSQADHDASLSWYEQGLALAREIGDERGTATALGNMGIVAVANDEPARAVELLEESIALSEPAGQHYVLAISRQALGSALLELGDTGLAATHLLHALTMHQELEDLLGIAVTLEELAAFAAAVGDGERAAAQLGAATAIRNRLGAPVPAVDEGRRSRTESIARNLVGSEQYDESHRDGLTTEPDVAVEAALAGCRRIAAATGGSASVD